MFPLLVDARLDLGSRLVDFSRF